MPKRRNQDRPHSPRHACMHALPPLYTHGTFITTTQSRPPPLLQLTGRGAADHRGEFRHNQPHPLSPAPSSSPCCNQQQQQHSSNHGRPLRAHAGALQVRLHLCVISSLCCLPVCAPFVFFFAPKPHHFSASHHHCPFHMPHHLPLPLSLLLPKAARPSRRIN